MWPAGGRVSSAKTVCPTWRGSLCVLTGTLGLWQHLYFTPGDSLSWPAVTCKHQTWRKTGLASNGCSKLPKRHGHLSLCSLAVRGGPALRHGGARLRGLGLAAPGAALPPSSPEALAPYAGGEGGESAPAALAPLCQPWPPAVPGRPPAAYAEALDWNYFLSAQ